MKKMMLAALLMLAMIFGTTPAFAQLCTTIQDGTLINSAGETITPGYDTWGYNYQARIFNGKYCDAYRNAVWCQPYVNDDLEEANEMERCLVEQQGLRWRRSA